MDIGYEPIVFEDPLDMLLQQVQFWPNLAAISLTAEAIVGGVNLAVYLSVAYSSLSKLHDEMYE